MLRLVLDTNVLVSALGWRGHPRQIVDMCLYQEAVLLESVEILNEFMRVINNPKFKFISTDDKEAFFIGLLELSDIVKPSIKIKEIVEDDADNRVLECAVAGGADYIITGDSHLLRLRKFAGIGIIGCSDFIKLIGKEQKQRRKKAQATRTTSKKSGGIY